MHIKVSTGGNDELANISLPVTDTVTSETVYYTTITYAFHTEARDPNVQAITQTRFEIVGDGIIQEIMINKGVLANSYVLHTDDILDNTKNREYKKQQSQEIIQLINNISSVKLDQSQDRATINVLANEIELKVSGKDMINSINIGEEGIAIAGKHILIDGETRFINSAGSSFGVVLEVNEAANLVVVYNNAKTYLTESTPDTLYSYNEAGVQNIFSYTSYEVSASNEKLYVLAGVTSNYPSVGDMWSSKQEIGGTTSIDGDKITTGSLTADKIVANTIGTDKLISKEILTNLLQVIGLNTVIISKEDGILIFGEASYEQQGGSDRPFDGYITNSNSIRQIVGAAELIAGDYVTITSTTAPSGSDVDYTGQTLRVSGFSGSDTVLFADQPFKNAPNLLPVQFTKIRPRDTDALTGTPNNSGSYIKISAKVKDPLDSDIEKPGIQIVHPKNGTKSTWTVDNFFMDSENSTIQGANGFFKLMKVGLLAASEGEKIIIDGTNRNIRSGNYLQGVRGFKLDGITGKAEFFDVDTVINAPRSMQRHYSSPWHYGGGESPRISHGKSLSDSFSYASSASNYETIGGTEVITTRYLVGAKQRFYLDSADVALDGSGDPRIKDLVIDISGSAQLHNMVNAGGIENALMQWYVSINGRTTGEVVPSFTVLQGKEHGAASYASDFITDAGGNFGNTTGSSPGFAYTCSLTGQMALDLSDFPLDELVTVEVGLKLNTYDTSETNAIEYRTELFDLNISMSLNYIGKNSSYT